jgi:xanthine dehydrogenase/oxidase
MWDHLYSELFAHLNKTVLVSHDGNKIGQGLHMELCWVADREFRIPLDNVYVNGSSTDKVTNSIPTAASMLTDTYVMATLGACH